MKQFPWFRWVWFAALLWVTLGVAALAGEAVPPPTEAPRNEAQPVDPAQLRLAPCKYHCFCKARCGGGPVGSSINDAILDWGAIKEYKNHCLNKEKNADDCTAACSAKAVADPNWNSAPFLCSKCPSGVITAYGGVATKEYKTAQTRKITKAPAVSTTTCTCPPEWMANNNQLGGVTSDGKCKRDWCQTATGIPGAANGTAVGSWGSRGRRLSWCGARRPTAAHPTV